jgi:hypothetical protein
MDIQRSHSGLAAFTALPTGHVLAFAESEDSGGEFGIARSQHGSIRYIVQLSLVETIISKPPRRPNIDAASEEGRLLTLVPTDSNCEQNATGGAIEALKPVNPRSTLRNSDMDQNRVLCENCCVHGISCLSQPLMAIVS